MVFFTSIKIPTFYLNSGRKLKPITLKQRIKFFKNHLYLRITKKEIFTYKIDDLIYSCFAYKDLEKTFGKERAWDPTLEVVNYELRDPGTLSPKLRIREKRANPSDIKKMISYFQAWLLKYKPSYIKINPYHDSPARRMRIFDRMMVEAGYNIKEIIISNYKLMNYWGKTFQPIIIYYTNKKEEFINRSQYENWLGETLKLEK